MQARILLLVAVCLVSQSLGCAVGELFRGPREAIAPLSEPDAIYEEIVDHYVELCAVTQYRPRDGVMGGSPGHAAMYIKGACVDETADYPRLRRCRYATGDTRDPEHGAGVSVNRWFKNANWVATPTRFLFFNGGVETFEMLDQERFDQAVQRAVDLGLYDGIELRPIRDASEAPSLEEFVRTDGIGTDFAVRFGRTAYCARLPLREEMLVAAMDYLNGLNEEYYNGEADYDWNGLSDNCVHTLHNALAAAGVWKPKSVRATKLRQFFNLAVPANTVIDLAMLSNEYPIEDFPKIQRDDLRWKGLTEHQWLPAVPGALLVTLPVLQINSLYDTKQRMFVLGGWFSNGTRKHAQKLLADGRYLRIDANLRYFVTRYDEILEGREEAKSWTDAVRSKRFLEDRGIYYEYIENARNRTIDAAERFREIEGLRREMLRESSEAWDRRRRELREEESSSTMN